MCTNAAIVPTVLLFFPETMNMPLEAADHLFENGGFTKGAHRGKRHVREIVRCYNLARQSFGTEESSQDPSIEVFEDKTFEEKKT